MGIKSACRAIFNSKRREDVFTPATCAVDNYVERNNLKKLEEAIEMPGVQVLLYGNSGCGKSSLISKAFSRKRRYVLVQCTSDTTFNDILNKAFQELNTSYQSQQTKASSMEFAGGIGGDLKGGSFNLQGKTKHTSELKTVPLVNPIADVRTLAVELGKKRRILIIDDFHNLNDSEKKKIADCMKIMVDNANQYKECKMICVGATDNPQELISYNTDLSNRVKNIRIDDMTDDDIGKIINNGCNLMNIVLSDDVRKRIIKYSHHLPSVAHNLCYSICKSAGINKTCIKKKKIKDKFLYTAMQDYIDSNAAMFESIAKTVLDSDEMRMIIKVYIDKNYQSLNMSSIHNAVNKKRKGINKDIIEANVNKLASPELNVLRYNEKEKKYYFSDVFLRVALDLAIEMDNKKRLDKMFLLAKNVDDITDIDYPVIISMLSNNLITLYDEDDKEN